jgi:uncharacterized RDD family membrane protein YckC
MPDEREPSGDLSSREDQHAFIPPGAPAPASEASLGALDPALAGFGNRFVGFVLDMAVIFLPWFLIAKLVEGSGKHSNALVLVLGLIPLVASVIYAWALLTFAQGQTLGMRLMGLRCVDASTGRSVSGKRAFGRAVAWLIFAIAWFVIVFDLLWPLWDKHNQTLHDKVASTYVVKTTSL